MPGGFIFLYFPIVSLVVFTLTLTATTLTIQSRANRSSKDD